jgi:phosphoglycolate phosphatase-like HAD superfamily hydrolase
MVEMALTFDFDGVILDSEPIKLQAFSSIFADSPRALDRIRTYNTEHRGVPRTDKISYICEHILHVDNLEAAVQHYLMRYADTLHYALLHAPLITGIAHFLDQTPYPKFICSSAPATEVNTLLHAHNIAQYFVQVFGYPDRKLRVLRQLKQQYQPLFFFGDAVVDYEAAQAACIPFIGVITPATRDRFANINVPIIEQFMHTRAIDTLLAQFT